MTVTKTETAKRTAATAEQAAGSTRVPAACDRVRTVRRGQGRYSISEVAAYTGLSAHTLRWYERIGLMPYVDRSHTGQRRFTDKDLDWLDLVGKLRLTGMSVADMVRYAELVREGEQTFPQRQELLTATRADVRRRIVELRETLAVLDFKIDKYAAANASAETEDASQASREARRKRMSTQNGATDGTLTKARLGADGPEVGVQGLGCMGMSFAYGPTDEDEARATLERALELGVTLYDTADVYGAGENEKFLAPFVRAHRDEVVVASKFGIVMDPEDSTRRSVCNDPAYIRQCVEGSLRRLGVDTIDLYYMHRIDPDVPIEDTVGAMSELVSEGKVAQLGLSEVTGAELRRAHAVHPIAALQSEWSVFSRDVERTAVPAAQELGVAFVPYSPLGRGFLTGSFVQAETELSSDDFRRTMPRFTGDNARVNAALIEPVRRLAAEKGVTTGQIALAWVHQQAQLRNMTVLPIPGTRRRSRVEENTAASRIELSAEELQLLDPIADQVAGGRYASIAFTSAGRE